MQIEDYHWLTSSEGAIWLERAAGDTRSTVQMATALRKELSAERSHLVLEQVELRKRGASKFPQAERMFFTRKGLEQATDLWLARYKARRFAAGSAMADLCCGIGGDLLALAERGPVVGVDRDPISAWLAQANLEVLGLSATANVIAQDIEPLMLSSLSAWHIDPDRRPGGRRVVGLDLVEPSIDVIQRLLAVNRNAAIKLAPATVVLPDQLPDVQLEWISRDGECKQLLATVGLSAEGEGTLFKTATALDRHGMVLRQVYGEELPIESQPPGKFVYEPDAAILAAKLEGQLAHECQLHAIGGGYLSGDSLVVDGGLTAFEVLETMPFDRRRLARWLAERNIGQVEVKCRDGRTDANRLQRELITNAEGRATVLLAPVAKSTLAIIANRI